MYLITSNQQIPKSYAKSLDLSYRKGTFCPRPLTAKDKWESAQSKMENEVAPQHAISEKILNHFDELSAKWERRS